ncbi:MAG: periplasmic binding protein [Deferribacteraceae bacterium]|jgi:iron complex transport system substrate-binding protein|nr:periplasmic binding protein [Deferribacteraceae bacterium]
MFIISKFLRRLCVAFIFIFLFQVSVYAKDIRIVSLTPSITKQLMALGIERNIVGCTSYCPLAQKKGANAKVIGSVSTINIEAILQLKPDVVIANSLTNLKSIEKLKSLNVNVEIFEYPKSIEDIFKTVSRLGKITGRVQEAEKIVDQSKSRLEKIKAKFLHKDRKKIIFLIGANPLFTAPKNTYIDDIINIINGVNIAGNLNSGIISKEFILKGNPDAIFIMNMGAIADDIVNDLKRYSFINAVKMDNLFIVDADRLGSPYLPDLIDLIENLGELVNR